MRRRELRRDGSLDFTTEFWWGECYLPEPREAAEYGSADDVRNHIKLIQATAE